jgi:uncharacterized protein (DUF1800 family)
VLELHTLGVHGGYVQGDVEAFARLLTGWSIDVGDRDASGARSGGTGAFTFYPQRHEPGVVTLLGRRYAKGTEVDGLDALHALALHPSTARHVATKLARAFVADAPPPSAIGKLEEAFRSSGGHLPTVHRALVDLDEAWAAPLQKLKSPWDLVQSTSRMLGPASEVGPDGMRLLKSLLFLGQLPYQAPSPKGWPDEALAWTGPEAVLARLEWAEEVARRLPITDVPALARSVLGPVFTSRTAQVMEGLDGRAALATLIGCPEFQRR